MLQVVNFAASCDTCGMSMKCCCPPKLAKQTHHSQEQISLEWKGLKEDRVWGTDDVLEPLVTFADVFKFNMNVLGLSRVQARMNAKTVMGMNTNTPQVKETCAECNKAHTAPLRQDTDGQAYCGTCWQQWEDKQSGWEVAGKKKNWLFGQRVTPWYGLHVATSGRR